MMIKSLFKISLFVKRVLFLAVLGQFCFTAQAQVVVSKWKGVDPFNLDPTTTVYLFNVGTGKFVIHGNRWGTQAILRFPDLGTGFKVTKNKKGTYLFDSEISNSSEYKTGNYLSLVLKGHGSDSGNSSDWGYYMDRNADYRFTLKRVAGTADNMYVYKLSQTLGSTYYMTANADGTTIDYSTTEPTGAAGYWVLVTKQALIENLKEGLLADAFGQLNADATYLLGDQNFSINNTDFDKWKQVPTGESGTDYRYDWRNSRVTTDCWNKLVVTKEWGGDNDKDKATNAMYSNVSIEGQGLFAYSDITAPAMGWYVIQCQGFYAGENPAYMYAKVVRNNKVVDSTAVQLQDASSDFPPKTSGSIQTRNDSKGLKAGKAFYDNSSNYLNQLYFYAQADDNITIGIRKPGAKKSDMDKTSNSSSYYHDLDYVAVDNFQLKFFGVSPVVFIDDKDNLAYLDNQNSVTENVPNASTMLKRNMTLGQWNTLVLPVDMSSAQLKAAFGDLVQLAQLSALNGTVLDFTSVDLSEDNPLKAGHIYIIKPQQSPVANSVTVNRANGTAVTVDGPFYNIGRHSYKDLDPSKLSVTESSPDGVMTAHGTYVNTKCPSGSYVLSHGDMYHIKSDTPVKGFRCWFTFDGNAPKNVSLAIDGIAEGAIPTGLEDLVDTRLQPSDIYNANGQLVRRGATTLDGLPKGVYIVNGKKIAVQ